jgi:hypothetical protein
VEGAVVTVLFLVEHLIAIVLGAVAIVAGMGVMRRYAGPRTASELSASRSGAICFAIGIIVVVTQVLMLATSA